MRLRFSILAVLGAAMVFTTGCAGATGQHAVGDLGANQQLAETCPKDHTLATYVGDDLSGTGRDDGIASTRTTVIQNVIQRTAVCSGHLRVSAFSSSVAATTTVFDADLQPAGATDIARLRKVPDLVTATMKTVSDGLAQANQKLPSDGSDITAQVGLAKEYVDQLNAGRSNYLLNLQLLTDGVQTTGVVLNTPDLSPASAVDLANRISVPRLPTGSLVKFAGLGKVVGPPPPTTYVDALKAFYLTYCQRTGATCAAVTDYTAGS